MPVMEAANSPLSVDADAFRADPHAAFAAIRPLAGVIDVGAGAPIVTRAADVERLMTDRRTRQVETEMLDARGVTGGALYSFYANSMLTSNAPAHVARRGPCMRAFAVGLIESWRPRIRALVRELAAEAAAEGETDFVRSVAAPLPSRIIAEFLGLPVEDAPRFSQMVVGMARGLSQFRDEDFPAVERAAAELTRYVEAALADRRAAPRDDFLTAYLAKVDEAGKLDAIETVTQIIALIIAGSDTTRLALTVTLAQLLRRREAWRALVADPALVPGAVREGLRYEPPVGSIARVAIEPLDVDGVIFQPGEVIALSILSAQRDPALYARPQVFDIRRKDHPKLSLTFGVGPHRCLGAALATAELEEALVALAETAPEIGMAGPAPMALGHSGIRGLTPMMVRWG